MPDTELLRIWTHRMNTERSLIVHMLRCPSRGMECVAAFGITAAHFDQPDLQAMFIAITHFAGREQMTVLQACKRALEWAGRWDDTEPAWSVGMNWSTAMLARAAVPEARPACPAMLPTLCVDLLNCVARINAQAGEAA